MLLPRNPFHEGSPSFIQLSPTRLLSHEEEALRALKETIVAQLMTVYAGLLDESLVRRAVNEADSLAALTSAPLLFLPELAVEKTAETWQWLSRQLDILDRSVLVITA